MIKSPLFSKVIPIGTFFKEVSKADVEEILSGSEIDPDYIFKWYSMQNND
jgi:hypothetical protein